MKDKKMKRREELMGKATYLIKRIEKEETARKEMNDK